MTENKYKHRYYYKEDYTSAIGTFATAIVFLFVAILSLFRPEAKGVTPQSGIDKTITLLILSPAKEMACSSSCLN